MLAPKLCYIRNLDRFALLRISSVARTMATLEEILAPPSCVRGMTTLDRTLFTRRLEVAAVRVNARQCSAFLHRLNHVTLRFPGIKKVQKSPGGNGEGGKLVSKGVTG